jgi:hypothetical protein
MMRRIFISYCQDDFDKVKILQDHLKEIDSIEPVIVADKREPLKPLAQKVSDNILSCEYFIPILTQNAITAQWINQEIGFAISSRRKILPIVENQTIDGLKGFIHKQIDIPYCFSSTPSENEYISFKQACELLVSDLEKDKTIGIELPSIERPKLIDKALEIKNKNDWEVERTSFLNSPTGLSKAEDEIKKLFEIIKKETEEIVKASGIWLRLESYSYRAPNLIIKAPGYSIALEWNIRYHGTTEGSSLIVQYWEGILISDITKLSPQERMKLKNRGTQQYYPNINKEHEIIWTDKQNESGLTSDKLAYHCINWLLTKSDRKNKT